MRREHLFFFFFLAFHFSKPLEFVLGVPKWEFATWKKHFTPGKNSGKIYVQKDFMIRTLNKQLLKNYQIFTKLPQIDIFKK